MKARRLAAPCFYAATALLLVAPAAAQECESLAAAPETGMRGAFRRDEARDSLVLRFARELSDSALVPPRLSVVTGSVSFTVRTYIDDRGQARCASLAVSSDIEDLDRIALGFVTRELSVPGRLRPDVRGSWLTVPISIGVR